jgi:hypothetical protein
MKIKMAGNRKAKLTVAMTRTADGSWLPQRCLGIAGRLRRSKYVGASSPAVRQS